mmetsp:Transcript_45376/g.114230  ORF Transcript_45376/g.114230 Transcript_45376/m.114230 type:complete len:307 (+) Transcript_45376:86-1006(+)
MPSTASCWPEQLTMEAARASGPGHRLRTPLLVCGTRRHIDEGVLHHEALVGQCCWQGQLGLLGFPPQRRRHAGVLELCEASRRRPRGGTDAAGLEVLVGGRGGAEGAVCLTQLTACLVRGRVCNSGPCLPIGHGTSGLTSKLLGAKDASQFEGRWAAKCRWRRWCCGHGASNVCMRLPWASSMGWPHIVTGQLRQLRQLRTGAQAISCDGHRRQRTRLASRTHSGHKGDRPIRGAHGVGCRQTAVIRRWWHWRHHRAHAVAAHGVANHVAMPLNALHHSLAIAQGMDFAHIMQPGILQQLPHPRVA